MSSKCIFTQFFGFDFDDGNIKKCQKHGVSIEEIEAAFGNSDLYVAPDLSHSQAEQRYRAVGQTLAGRKLFLDFTFRNYKASVLPRVTSARFMHKKEIEEYEEDISQL